MDDDRARRRLANLGDGHIARGNIANALLFEGDTASLIENAIGGAGDDTLIANQAANQLTGNGGADIFKWMSTGDAGTGALADTIADFLRGTDKIDLAAIDADPARRRRQAFTFIGTSAFHNVAGELRYQVTGGNVHVFGDVDGNGIADMEIIVNNNHDPLPARTSSSRMTAMRAPLRRGSLLAGLALAGAGAAQGATMSERRPRQSSDRAAAAARSRYRGPGGARRGPARRHAGGLRPLPRPPRRPSAGRDRAARAGRDRGARPADSSDTLIQPTVVSRTALPFRRRGTFSLTARLGIGSAAVTAWFRQGFLLLSDWERSFSGDAFVRRCRSPRAPSGASADAPPRILRRSAD